MYYIFIWFIYSSIFTEAKLFPILAWLHPATAGPTAATPCSGRRVLKMYQWIFPVISHRNLSLSSCCCDTKTTNNPLADPPCQTQVTASREQKTRAIHASDIITMCVCLHWFPGIFIWLVPHSFSAPVLPFHINLIDTCGTLSAPWI